MPTYDYRCTSCGHQFEKFQKFTDEPLKVCPVCGQELRKVFHAAGVVFKGSGWYINDSRKTDTSVIKSDKVESPAADATKTQDTAAPAESPKADSAAPAEGGKTESKTEKAAPKKKDTPAAPAA